MELSRQEYEEITIPMEALFAMLRKRWVDEAYDAAFQVWLGGQWVGKQGRRKYKQ